MEIAKMHGLGNSQILVEDLKESVQEEVDLNYSKISQALCDPNFGVGADQTLIILPSDEADFRIRIFNKDGGEAEMCGNGIRCVAKYLYDKGKVDKELQVETMAGVKNLEIFPEAEPTQVQVKMGLGEIIKNEKGVKGFEGVHVSVGNPHFVIFTEGASKELAAEEGSGLENAEEFQPERINVEFVKLISEEELEVYVWERGAGLTLACGTGACAAAFAAKKRGLAAPKMKVKLLGGNLHIRADEDDRITLQGPAEYILEGQVLDVDGIKTNLEELDQ